MPSAKRRRATSRPVPKNDYLIDVMVDTEADRFVLLVRDGAGEILCVYEHLPDALHYLGEMGEIGCRLRTGQDILWLTFDAREGRVVARENDHTGRMVGLGYLTDVGPEGRGLRGLTPSRPFADPPPAPTTWREPVSGYLNLIPPPEGDAGTGRAPRGQRSA
jgi:hypothetical protein